MQRRNSHALKRRRKANLWKQTIRRLRQLRHEQLEQRHLLTNYVNVFEGVEGLEGQVFDVVPGEPVAFVVRGLDGSEVPESLSNWLQDVGARVHISNWNDILTHDNDQGRVQIGNVTIDDGHPGAWSPLDFNLASATPFREYRFVRQMQSAIENVPEDSPIILIGHGFGGDSLISATDDSFFSFHGGLSRDIDVMALLDPIGIAGFRSSVITRNISNNIDHLFVRSVDSTKDLAITTVSVATGGLGDLLDPGRLASLPIDPEIPGLMLNTAAGTNDQAQQAFRRDANGTFYNPNRVSFHVPGFEKGRPVLKRVEVVIPRFLNHEQVPNDLLIQRELQSRIENKVAFPPVARLSAQIESEETLPLVVDYVPGEAVWGHSFDVVSQLLPIEVDEGETITLLADGSVDQDGDAIAFDWSLDTTYATATSNLDESFFSLTVNDDFRDEAMYIEPTLSLNSAGTDGRLARVRIKPINVAPTVEAKGPALDTTAHTDVQFVVTVFDAGLHDELNLQANFGDGESARFGLFDGQIGAVNDNTTYRVSRVSSDRNEYQVVITHQFDQPSDVYQTEFFATDDDGGQSESERPEIQIGDVTTAVTTSAGGASEFRSGSADVRERYRPWSIWHSRGGQS